MNDQASQPPTNPSTPASPDAGVDQLLEQGHLFDLYDRMLGEADVVKALQQTTDVVHHLLDAERATIYHALPETDELESLFVVGNVRRRIRIPISRDSLAGFCALTRRSFVVPDAYADLSAIDPELHFDAAWDRVNTFRTRDVMCAPAVFRDELLGVVQVINSRGAAFTDLQLRMLENTSRFVAYALYYARLCEEIGNLKRLDKEKANFMRVMVHELKGPVAASKSLVQSLAFVTDETDSKALPVLQRVEKRLDGLLTLIADLLSLSQVKQGTPLGEIVVVDAVAETRNVYEQYLEPARLKGLAMHIEAPPHPLPLRIDVRAFHLVVSNLISNAVKYTASGSVSVLLRADKGQVALTVRDTGMGIPEAEYAKLFNEFFRASNARKSSVPGTGVGLNGAKELVERFQGVIAFESAVNEGTAFTVRLPLYEGTTATTVVQGA